MCETADSITNLGKSMTFFEISIFEKEIQKLNFRFSRNALPLHNVLGFFTFLFYIDLKLRETAGNDCKFNFAKAITRTRRNFSFKFESNSFIGRINIIYCYVEKRETAAAIANSICFDLIASKCGPILKSS